MGCVSVEGQNIESVGGLKDTEDRLQMKAVGNDHLIGNGPGDFKRM